MAPELERFRAWLVGRGRGSGTADLYVSDVRLALAEETMVAHLLSRDLAPKTKRHHLAALRAWARWRSDTALLAELADVKLPAPSRKLVRKPLLEAEWHALVAAIENDKALTAPMRATLLLMATRGFRCGDVLRLERAQVQKALAGSVLSFEAKGGRWVQFTVAPLREALGALLEYGDWVRVDELISPGAEPARRRKLAWQTVSRRLRTVAARAGLTAADVHTHRLRRTYAVMFLREMKGDPEALQKLQKQMQWANSATLFEYTDFISSDELDAVNDRLAEKRRR